MLRGEFGFVEQNSQKKISRLADFVLAVRSSFTFNRAYIDVKYIRELINLFFCLNEVIELLMDRPTRIVWKLLCF